MKSNLSYKHQAPMGYLIHEVARLMKRRFEEEAKVHGITLPQWRVLAQIALNDGITQVGLATAADTDPMTISGVLDPAGEARPDRSLPRPDRQPGQTRPADRRGRRNLHHGPQGRVVHV